jgi:hypothetical protein
LVLKVSASRAWSNEEVCQRWMKLYHSHPLVERLLSDTCSCQAEKDEAQKY